VFPIPTSLLEATKAGTVISTIRHPTSPESELNGNYGATLWDICASGNKLVSVCGQNFDPPDTAYSPLHNTKRHLEMLPRIVFLAKPVHSQVETKSRMGNRASSVPANTKLKLHTAISFSVPVPRV